MFKKFKNFITIDCVALLALSIVYGLTHLFGLLELPVFADEAIYIRWAQLFIDEPARYAFFSMNDGKTPLFFWLLAPFQFLFENQLYAARFVGVLIGFVQMLVVIKTTALFTKNKVTIYLSGLLVTMLPFWYLHHRMALTDGLLTLFISLSMFFLLRDVVAQKNVQYASYSKLLRSLLEKKILQNIVLSGLFFGLALLSKVPAILAILSFVVLTFLVPVRSKAQLFLALHKVGLSALIGLCVFGLLALSPSFGQLFSRGGDFLLPLSEVVAGKWQETLPNIPNYLAYFSSYTTLFFLIFIFFGLFGKKNKVLVHVFVWASLLFIFPIAILGKVVYARYLLPALIFLTLAGVFAIEDIFLTLRERVQQKFLQSLLLLVAVLCFANMITYSSIFIYYSITDHASVPFVASDRTQYLTEWSSGHGLVEVVQLLQLQSQKTTIAVATEGSFGSLPDGLNLYFHRKNVDGIYIEGIGYPVEKISKKFVEQAQAFERKWLVINSHRMLFAVDRKYLLAEYCRPGGICLQVWDITEVFDTLPY